MIRKEIYICKKFWSSPCRIQQISKLIFMASSQSIAVSFEVKCSKLLVNQYYLFLFRLIQAFLNTKQKRHSEWFYLRNHFWSWTILSSWLSGLLPLNLKIRVIDHLDQTLVLAVPCSPCTFFPVRIHAWGKLKRPWLSRLASLPSLSSLAGWTLSTRFSLIPFITWWTSWPLESRAPRASLFAFSSVTSITAVATR